MFNKEKRTFGRSERTTRTTKTKRAALIFRKRYCRLCVGKIDKVDYKDKILEKFISERGKILSRRYTGNCARHQRSVVEAIKRARFIALLPYIKL